MPGHVSLHGRELGFYAQGVYGSGFGEYVPPHTEVLILRAPQKGNPNFGKPSYSATTWVQGLRSRSAVHLAQGFDLAF